MISDFIEQRITAQLPFTPNEQQTRLIHLLALFTTSNTDDRLFLLRGYAGTGKTSLVSALIRAMSELQQPTVLLAPTGRAAKVLASYSGHAAHTIHKQIYRQQSMGAAAFSLAPNMKKDTLFIVDEASMIANTPGDNSMFGTGCLLDDLIHYVYSGTGCSLILLGDTAQLPPVGQTLSPALDRRHLEGYGLHVTDYELTAVARQTQESGILHNATWLRQQIATDNTHTFPTLQTRGFSDIRRLDGIDIQEWIENSYDEVGMEETMVVTRTNRRSTLYNQGIRGRILWHEDLLQTGDRIMVTRNNYFWSKDYEQIDFIANGDIFEVTHTHNECELYGFRFVDADLQSVDYDWEISATLLLDSLTADTQEAIRAIQNTLFEQVAADYPEIHSRRELVKKVMESPYFNALQVRHAYAATCHKAQGGQWKHVFIDPGTLQPEQINTDFYRWLYTAVTRATERVFLLNMSQKKHHDGM